MLKKVSPKDPLNIPASTWNAFIDATRQSEQKKGFKSTPSTHNTPYYIKNNTGKRLPIYSVLMVTGLATDFPSSADTDANLNYFIGTEIVFKGEIPDKDSQYFNKICITQEPLEIDGVGLGVLDGIAKCNMLKKEQTIFSPFIKAYLSPIDGNTDYLSLSNFGTIELVYGQADQTETVYQAIITLGGAVVPNYFLVDLIWKSGGDSTTVYEPRIYDISLNNYLLRSTVDVASGDNPYRRPQDFNVTKATIGMAFTGGDGGVLIAWCNEHPLLGTPEVMP